MKFLVTWQLHADAVHEVMEVWGGLSPAERADVGPGVKMLGRWHEPTSGTGVFVAETSDLSALNVYLGQWTPFMDMTVVPVLDDEESAAVCREIVANMEE